MRVIAGVARGCTLRSLPGRELRPMLDRVRESLFNILADLVEEARVLDLFAGTGSLGVEALSRGAGGCVFVERDARLVRLIEENVARCKLAEKAHIARADVLGLPGKEPVPRLSPAFLALCDPPYKMVDDPQQRGGLLCALEGMCCNGWIAGAATVMVHHRPLSEKLWESDVLIEVDRRVYGNSQLTFFRVGKGDSER